MSIANDELARGNWAANNLVRANIITEVSQLDWFLTGKSHTDSNHWNPNPNDQIQNG